MPGRFKQLFSEFLRTARKLWLEMMGALFLVLSVMFFYTTVIEYRKTTDPISSWDMRTTLSILGSGVFALLTLFFSLQSFWKSRKLP